MTGALGHGPVHYDTLSWSDVTRWTRDRALRRYFDCAAAHVGPCNSIGPTCCPAARQPNRRVPPRTTACARQALGDDPRASKGPPRRQQSRAPRNARQSGGEAQPGGCAIRVRRPLPSTGNQRPNAGRNSGDGGMVELEPTNSLWDRVDRASRGCTWPTPKGNHG